MIKVPNDEMIRNTEHVPPQLVERAIPRAMVHPVLGTIHEIVDGATILEVRLRKAEQNVYYSVDEARGVISIHTVWGARRGRKPKL